MALLIPVDHDPFADDPDNTSSPLPSPALPPLGPQRVYYNEAGQPFTLPGDHPPETPTAPARGAGAAVTLIPVDHDPFAGDNAMHAPAVDMTTAQPQSWWDRLVGGPAAGQEAEAQASQAMAPVVTGAARAIGGDVGDIVGGLVHTAMIPGEVWQHGQPGSPEGEEQAREFAMTFGLGGGAAPEGALGMGAVRRARSAGEAATAGAPPAAAPLAAPMIGRGTEAPMFDYSRLAEQPDVPQFDLPRAPPPPKGIPERVQAVADPANLARVNAAVQRGVELGGPEWYGTQPLRDRFIGELGEAEGPAAYQRYLDYVAATSNASKVPENIRNASYYYTLERQGLPPPELVPSPTSPGNVTLAEPLPSPYGHFAQISHARNVRDVLSEGGWNVLQNPKPPSFVQNLAGNWQPLTIDRHNVRLLGLTGDVPPAGTYGYLEDLQRGEAARMGLAPAQYQASSWLGAGQETGLASPVEPFLQTVENRIRLTAKARGETPEVTLGRWIRGEAPLLSIPAAAVGTTLAAELAGVDQPLRD